MKIAIAADHAGFSLKEALRDKLASAGHDVIDFGPSSDESTDYPDYALAASERVASGDVDRGILVCYTGIGMSIAANKVPGIRAALGASEEAVALTRSHNDANVLALGAKFTGAEEAGRLVDVFLSTAFDGGPRHARRIEKIAAIERRVQEEHPTKA